MDEIEITILPDILLTINYIVFLITGSLNSKIVIYYLIYICYRILLLLIFKIIEKVLKIDSSSKKIKYILFLINLEITVFYTLFMILSFYIVP